MCLFCAAHFCINPERSSLKAADEKAPSSSSAPGGDDHLHIHVLLLIVIHAPASSFGKGVPFQGARVALPRGTSAMTGFTLHLKWNIPSNLKSLLLHLSALQEAFFLEIWHFLILACFPGQQTCPPAFTIIQQRRIKHCHHLCAFAILPSMPAPGVAGSRAMRASCAFTQRMFCWCSTCQTTSNPSPANTEPVPEIGRSGTIQGTDSSKPGMAKISYWVIQLLPFTSLAISVPCLWPCISCLSELHSCVCLTGACSPCS